MCMSLPLLDIGLVTIMNFYYFVEKPTQIISWFCLKISSRRFLVFLLFIFYYIYIYILKGAIRMEELVIRMPRALRKQLVDDCESVTHLGKVDMFLFTITTF